MIDWESIAERRRQRRRRRGPGRLLVAVITGCLVAWISLGWHINSDTMGDSLIGRTVDSGSSDRRFEPSAPSHFD